MSLQSSISWLSYVAEWSWASWNMCSHRRDHWHPLGILRLAPKRLISELWPQRTGGIFPHHYRRSQLRRKKRHEKQGDGYSGNVTSVKERKDILYRKHKPLPSSTNVALSCPTLWILEMENGGDCLEFRSIFFSLLPVLICSWFLYLSAHLFKSILPILRKFLICFNSTHCFPI